jgi:hypothetical protein
MYLIELRFSELLRNIFFLNEQFAKQIYSNKTEISNHFN